MWDAILDSLIAVSYTHLYCILVYLICAKKSKYFGQNKKLGNL